MLLSVLKNGEAFLSVLEVLGECGGGEDVRTIGALKKDIVNVGWWVVGFIKMKVDDEVGCFLIGRLEWVEYRLSYVLW
jgi:hypothetical protein